MIRIAAFAFISIILLAFANPIFAQEEEKFSTKYNVLYTVLGNGKTQVLENVQLINKTDEFRASEFSLELSIPDIQNVQASDGEGPILAKIEKLGDTTKSVTKITLTFNQVVIGKDRMLPFTISFETSSLTKRKGLIWEVNIPGFEKRSDIEDYNVTLTVPQSFGLPAYVKPSKNLENQKLVWTKDEIPKGGMLVGFGQFQIYKFNLRYNLKNPRLYPIKTEIAIPPDTNYQKIFINSINPAPLDVEIDPDENWLAKYELSPSTTKTVNVTASAQVFLSPQENQILGALDRKKYLEASIYWDVNDNDIKQLAEKLEFPRSIYDFIVSELNYDIKRVEGRFERLGAAGALESKNSAVCMEFTDLFIALSRAAGIPSREINGFAYTESSEFRPLSLVRDILHAWPEYYNEEKNTWVMVDPTWGNTTGGQDFFDMLDFDHVAFVIKGRNSEYPIPAGGYKIKGVEESRDVNMSFGNLEDLKPKKDRKIDLIVPQKNSSFFPIKAKLVITNNGNEILASQNLTIRAFELSPTSQEVKINSIPPFGKEELVVSFQKASPFEPKLTTIYIQGEGTGRDFEILVSPFIISNKILYLILGGVFGASTIVFFTIKARRIYLQRRQEQSSIRGESTKSQGKSS